MIKFIAPILIIFQFISCAPVLQSYKSVDRMDKKQLDFPTSPHKKEIQVYYSELNILPKDSFYILQTLSTTKYNTKDQKIEHLKTMAQANGLDAIIVTGVTPLHKSYEKSNITLLDLLTDTEPDPPTTVNYTVTKLYAQGIKFKKNTDLHGLVKKYDLYEVKNGEKEFVTSILPINNMLPYNINTITNEINTYSLDYIVDYKGANWKYLNDGKVELRVHRSNYYDENTTYEIVRDENKRIKKIKCKSQYEMDIYYNKSNKVDRKYINEYDFAYEEKLNYNAKGQLISKQIAMQNKKKRDKQHYILDIEYYNNNNKLSDYKSILYKIKE